jgi:exopolysaccharide biosynthesis operon protein EpsL
MAFASGTALAQQPPADQPVGLSLSAGVNVIRDSNLFRIDDATPLQPGTSRSDTTTQLNARLRAATEVSLQRFSLQATLNNNRFSNNSYLNNSGGRLLGQWDWQVGDFASGTLNYGAQRSLANFGEALRQSRDILTTRGPAFTGRYRVGVNNAVTGELGRQTNRHSDPNQRLLDNDVDSLALGWQFVSGSENTVGAEVRQFNANYQFRQPVGAALVSNDYRQRDAGLVTTWRYSGLTRIIGRAGYTQRRHDEFSGRNFGGFTGIGTVEYEPTGKLTFRLTGGRDLSSTDESQAAYVLVDSIGLAPSWRATNAITVDALAGYERRSYEGDPFALASGGPRRKDNAQRWRLGVTYKPADRWELNVGAEFGKRDSNFTLLDYDYRQFQIGARLNL